MLANGENIPIGDGSQGSFPHLVHNRLFEEVLAGRSVLACSSSDKTKKVIDVPAPKQPSKTK